MSDERPVDAAAGGDEDAVALTPEQAERERRRARRVAWASRAGVVVLRLLALTWRIRAVHGDVYEGLRRRRQPFALCFWHGEMLPLLWRHRDQGIAVLISTHKDGEIIARIAEALGCRTVRGSTSRGGGRALLGLVRELRAGHEIAVTPDGPRGPARRFQAGALIAAQRAAAPIVPIAVHCTSAWRLRSWDGFMIPRPFARIVVAYGDAAWVEAATPREAAAEAPRFEAALAAAAERARVAAGRA